MAIRPPQTESSEPEAVTFGIAAVDDHLRDADLTFPLTTRELVRETGDPSVPYDAAGNEVRLSDALDELSRDRFQDEAELLDHLHPVFERYRERSATSLLTRVRLLLPF